MGRIKAHESSQSGSRCKPDVAVPGAPIEGVTPSPGLHIVATPIGNLRDITLRALDVLRGADAIICEDTRVTQKLLSGYGIKKALTVYHDHNAERVRPALLDRLRGNACLALVSDAGTPLISDPGFKLVRDAVAAGIPVSTCPGPSAALAALVLSGLPSDRFLFAGFLPAKAGPRRAAIETLARADATLILFESVRRLPRVLPELAAVLGPRQAAVAREMTKLYEEVRRGTLADLAEHYGAAGAPKGEAVVVVAPPLHDPPLGDRALDDLIHVALRSGSVRDAADQVAAETGSKRRDIYRRALELSAASGRDEP